jgi:predicted RNA-binding Zn ribbon-like protein
MEAGDDVSAADLKRVVDVREGLRAVLLQNNGLPLDESRVERLDRAVRRAGVRVRFVPGHDPELVPDAVGVDGAIARLMAIVAAAVEHGRWERLKACPREECEWAFYDKSKNRSGRWCTMESCGNIEKAKAFRERQRR